MRLYRIKNAVRAVATEESGNRLTELPAGAVFSLTNVEPDSNGMIEGTSGELTVLLFLNDLEERAELMNVRIPAATVRVAPEISQH
jgi:hypothetical protein